MERPLYRVTREFTGGTLAGTTYTEITAVARRVGQVVDRPAGGSPYRITACESLPPSCGSGWTGDRCTLPLGHDGDHSNEGDDKGRLLTDPDFAARERARAIRDGRRPR